MRNSKHGHSNFLANFQWRRAGLGDNCWKWEPPSTHCPKGQAVQHTTHWQTWGCPPSRSIC